MRTMVFCHATTAVFGHNAQFYGLDTKQMFKFGTWPSAVAGVVAFVLTALLSTIGLSNSSMTYRNTSPDVTSFL